MFQTRHHLCSSKAKYKFIFFGRLSDVFVNIIKGSQVYVYVFNVSVLNHLSSDSFPLTPEGSTRVMWTLSQVHVLKDGRTLCLILSLGSLFSGSTSSGAYTILFLLNHLSTLTSCSATLCFSSEKSICTPGV